MTIMKTALCAAATLFATEANAARTLTLTFEATGGGATFNGFGSNGPIYSGFQSAILQYVVNVTDGVPLFTNFNGSGQTTFTLSPTGLVFDFSTINSMAFRGAEGKACFDGSAGLNVGIVQSSPTCSSLTFEQRSPSGPGGIRFFGAITRLTVADGSLLPTGVNFSFASIVPEPSTWALMLAGFALTGYALRRKRNGIVFGCPHRGRAGRGGGRLAREGQRRDRQHLGPPPCRRE